MSGTSVDFSDVQGILRFGYRRLTEASFLLLRIRDVAAARRWLRTAPVTDAVERASAPPTALQIAFTYPGLERLGLPRAALDGFAVEFRSGMAGDAGRSRLLGDVGRSAPARWDWGTGDADPHLVALFYAQPGQLHDWIRAAKGPEWETAFAEIACLATTDLGGVEPFGFADGISQPALDWERTRDARGDQLTYSNVSSLGEFVLGYPNEYGRITDRPLLAANDLLAADLLPMADDTRQRDFGRNGSYLVLRTLEQDVHGFWRFVDAQAHARLGEAAADRSETDAAAAHGTALAGAREELAQAMVGRTRPGDPLVQQTKQEIPGVEPGDAAKNNFTFDSDRLGTRCPFGAHIRRANPRNADLPTPAVHGLVRLLNTLCLGARDLHSDSKASTRFHRILRRGREYGTCISEDEAIHGADTGAHGIHFIALVANIARQFEFLQSAWLMSPKFDALTDESDPLLGNREPLLGGAPTGAFTRPREDGIRDRIAGLPQFVRVRGGAYFFLPSLRAIRYLSRLGEMDTP